MLKNLIVLQDGTEISSGAGTANSIKSHTLTACVNDAVELSLGSVCANALEMTLFTPSGNLSLTAGDEVTLYKVDDAGNRVKKGVFILEKPTRPTANTTKTTGYDRIVKLDKDLTEWVKGLTGWPYALKTFAKMVCAECGLNLVDSDIPNADFPIYAFLQAGATGRKIMKWIGEICCRFCRANADGNIELAWYQPSGVAIAPTGDRYFFQGALSYETYQVAPVEAVQIRLADSTSGALWPEVAEGTNSYVITGNAILTARVTEDLLPHLKVIEAELGGVTYTPCKVSLPASLDIDAGSIVNITDKNGATISAYVMTKTTTGQKDTLECTGSIRRDSSTASNNKTAAEKSVEMENYANAAAQKAVESQTQKDIFNKLTNYGELQGLYYQNGKWYINAEFVQIINLVASSIVSGLLASVDGKTYFDLDSGKIASCSKDGTLSLSIEAGLLSFVNLLGGALYLSVKDGRPTLVLTTALGEELYLSPGRVGVGQSAGSTPDATLISRDSAGAGRSKLLIEEIAWTEKEDSLPFVFLGKEVAWQKNSDGTYTLIGT
jgi:hypothetical protein